MTNLAKKFWTDSAKKWNQNAINGLTEAFRKTPKYNWYMKLGEYGKRPNIPDVGHELQDYTSALKYLKEIHDIIINTRDHPDILRALNDLGFADVFLKLNNEWDTVWQKTMTQLLDTR